MLLTLCLINQLPQAFALAKSFCQHTALSGDAPESPVLIGLADDPDHLPADFVSPYPLLFVRDMLPADRLMELSNQYTPVEFVAACKPLFIADVFNRYPAVSQFLYADPNILFFANTAPIWSALSSANVLLTPHVTQAPSPAERGPARPNRTRPDRTRPDRTRPDQKHLQNVGLYSSDFMAFRRSDETRRLLAWWQDRVTNRAHIDFCAGLCLDQLWLMHVPVFFRAVTVVKNPGWHVALWNLYERPLHQSETGWQVSSPNGTPQPLLFVNTKGLLNPDEGLFTRIDQHTLTQRADVKLFMQQYRAALLTHQINLPAASAPAYGSRPTPVVLRGWRGQAVQQLRTATNFVNQMPLLSVR